ncbi:GNAT family N-acetyltransferase [Clavibacter californiensis]|uniref:GNAT family N-acetyltransferase n=1 Tax=Clavibacter californiensis TaxID=1401995 RepID=A0ABX9N5U0_9MICO|nr:GNAT family N-acetyltransferase [Clavibacter californiensis]RII91815.1 GNAT family N-acetyltransferase [Clavibacter californiensis]UKF80048.1 GNAT family N-acetyltransferase [Clavibacter californiensis]
MRPPAGLTEIADDRDGDIRDIARALSTWFPASTHPGGFAWEASTGQLPERIAVVRDDAGAVIGWAAYSADDARVECAPGDDGTTDLLAAWLLDAAGDAPVSIAVHRSQDRLRGILAARGFVDEAIPLAGLRHAARDTGARPPAGYRIRPVAEGEEQAKVDAHRRAWKPVELPFTDGSGEGIDPDAESRFDADGYAAMQTAAVYRRELDLVVEAPDGTLAGTCTAWLDPATGWAELEPLGIVPAHRRLGLAQTLALDVCRRVGELGGHDVFINASPLPHYRAPWDAYVAAGFAPMERGTRMRPRA